MKMLILLSLAVLTGCSSKKIDEKINSQSIVIHNSMIKKAQAIEDVLTNLVADSLSTVNADSIATLLQMLEEWENDLVEVPGNKDHQHEGRHHDHKPLDVTAEQMLEIQQELDTRLSMIGKRLDRLL
jgi:hypothetical protein